MLFEGGFTFTNFIVDVFAIFIFILWFWLFITVASDLFRRHDISGIHKVLWLVILIFLPYLGVFAYLFTQSHGMALRNQENAKQMRDHLRATIGFSVADELEKIEHLKETQKISADEYQKLRAKLLE